jgi:uncharacterized integral membrane protein (TIGR00698 family)
VTTTDVNVDAGARGASDPGRIDVGDATAHRLRPATVAPALVAVALGLGVAAVGHRLAPQVGVLTWAVGTGIVAANLGLLPAAARPGLAMLTRKLLRIGVTLLGFSISLSAVAALGAPVVAVVAVTLVATLLFTVWLARRLRVSGPRGLLIATGVAICGASAIAAMEETAGADEEDATAAIALITLFGTVAMLALPLLRDPLRLTDLQYGVWAGASVHEVGQVVAAASPAGAAVVATAMVVKLTRVLLLAPVVATVSAIRRSAAAGARRTPLVPLFVLGFVACAAVRSTGVVPAVVLGWIGTVQIATLGAALFGMGAAVHLGTLVKRSGPPLALASVSTLFITGVGLVAALTVV